jgi:hypothetical protein
MRILLASALALVFAGTALAQTGSAPSGGAPSTGAPSTGAPPASSLPLPATPSQRNLEARPPTTSMPPGQTVAPPSVVPEQPKSATDPRSSDQSVPPSAGKRPAPGGAGSSELSTKTGRTGKNPMNETLRSCLNMWDAATHMSRQEWARACRRVENRLQNLQVDADVSNLKTGIGANRRRRE